MSLDELCQMDRRHVRPSDPSAAQLPLVGVEHVAADTGAINLDSDSRVGDQKSATFRFDGRHVLYGKLRPYLNKVATPDFAGRCSTELIPLLPQDGVDRNFLAYLLRQKETVDFAMASVTGSRMPRTDMNFLLSMRVPLPPLDEQRRIVAVLNRAARIERLRAQAAERLREFVPALFVRMFGDPFKNPKRWTVRRLREVCVSARYGTSRKPTIANDEGMPVIRMGNVTYDGYLDLGDLKSVVLSDIETEKHSLKAGDILFNRTNSRELVGKTGIWDGRFAAVAASYFIRIRLDESRVRPAFTWAFLNSASSKQRLLSMSRGAIGQANINAQEIQSIDLPLPPIEIQERFAQIVEQAHQLALRTEVAATGAAELSNSMMAKLLSSRETSASDGTQIETRSSGV